MQRHVVHEHCHKDQCRVVDRFDKYWWIMTYSKKIIWYFIKHPVVEALSTWHSTSQINTPAIYLNFYKCNKATEVPKWLHVSHNQTVVAHTQAYSLALSYLAVQTECKDCNKFTNCLCTFHMLKITCRFSSATSDLHSIYKGRRLATRITSSYNLVDNILPSVWFNDIGLFCQGIMISGWCV